MSAGLSRGVPTRGTRPAEIDRLMEHGIKAHQAGKADEALAAFREVLRHDPDHLGALNNLGVILKTLDRFAPAIAHYRRALAIKPDDAGLLANLGNALRGLGRLDEAEAALRSALELKPDSVDALNNLALVHKAAGRWPEAIEGLSAVLRLRPESAESHFDRALTYLQSGDLARGFAEYEWRWRVKESGAPRSFAKPRWAGEPLAGQTILLYAEQGFGDTIQFARYVPLVVARGGKVILECQPPLAPLLASLEGNPTVVARGAPLPAFDVEAPLLSLPYILGTTLESIPAATRYLAAPSGRADAYRARLGALSPSLKVGIAWAGKPSHRNDHNRSAGFAPFVELLGIPGTRWFSLQVGARADEFVSQGCAALVDDLTAEFADFSVSAAFIESLDLVITVDSAPAHLAGALGVPVWVALPFGGEWRYLHDRDDCPWYPSMRLFRQESFGDWSPVFRRLADTLADLVKAHAAR
ncbi:MAG: tetratricopeptide repeat protein [Alphaproteobacteria bacterium]|nr:tetratricopeptide repeat protein [Alphaproteobacteria bacterium]